MRNISILDYGIGNLMSLKRAFDYIGKKSKITSKKKDIMSSSHLILPGVGSFGNAIKILRDKKLDKIIHDYIKTEKPILGICLGMQLLFEKSNEFGIHEGLGFVEGKVQKILIKKINTPIIGWHKINFVNKKDVFLKKNNNSDFYFLHSYQCVPSDKKYILANYKLNNKNNIVAVIKKKNVYGCQFHPEKSSLQGISFLKEFLQIT
jgi:glutamine amidotransferase